MAKWKRKKKKAADVYGNTARGAFQYAMAQGLDPSVASRAIANLYGGWRRPAQTPTQSMPPSSAWPVSTSDGILGHSRDPLQDMIDLYSEVAQGKWNTGTGTPSYSGGPGVYGPPMVQEPRKDPATRTLRGPWRGQHYDKDANDWRRG